MLAAGAHRSSGCAQQAARGGWPRALGSVVLWGGLAVVPLAGCDRSDRSGLAPVATTPERQPVQAAESLPKQLETVDLEGFDQLLREAAELDQVVVIDFWATWCVPCVAMFPQLHDALRQVEPDFPGRLRFVSISFDEAGGESEKQAIQFLANQQALNGARIFVADSDEQTRFARKLSERYGESFNVMAVPAYVVKGPREVRGTALGGGGAYSLDQIVDAARRRLMAPGLE